MGRNVHIKFILFSFAMYRVRRKSLYFSFCCFVFYFFLFTISKKRENEWMIKNWEERNTYATCNDGHSILVNRRMYHFYIGHVQHNVDHMAIDRIDFQHSPDYSDIFPIHKFHLVHSLSYKRLQKPTEIIVEREKKIK